MKETRLLMGMPITVEIIADTSPSAAIAAVFAYFSAVDNRFSTYKATSEISQINAGNIHPAAYSKDMRLIFSLAEQTKRETNGYFDMQKDERIDPSGIVKGWAIQQAANWLREKGFNNFYIDAGGDVQVDGNNEAGKPWHVGIRNPFNRNEIVKVVRIQNQGIATSGTAVRGQHIYNPFQPNAPITDVVSITVIGPNVYEADRFATAAFAMGANGIGFINALHGFAGYQIDANGMATYTENFEQYVVPTTRSVS